NGGWFAGLPIGDFLLAPKKLRLSTREHGGVIRIGEARGTDSRAGLDVQTRISVSAEFAIVEVLFLWQFGPLLDGLLSRNVLGYRLDLRRGELSPTRRWLFE